MLAYKSKGHRFDSQSRAHAWVLVGACERQPHIDVALPLSLTSPL